jgi:hypothetical protein
VEQHAERPANAAEHFHDGVGDGVVLGGQFGLGGDRGDARHDEFPYLLLVWRQIMLSMLEAGQTPAPCVIFLQHSSIPEILP